MIQKGIQYNLLLIPALIIGGVAVLLSLARVSYAVPAAPSSTCEITATVLNIRKKRTNIGELGQPPRQDFDYHAVRLKIHTVLPIQPAASGSCASLLFSDQDTILHLNDYSKSPLHVGYKIKARMEFGGDEWFSGYFLSGVVVQGVSLSRNLGFGARGQEVLTLQHRLQEFGNFPRSLLPTGYFGSITKKAVQEFQKANSIPATGFVGPLTRQSLSDLAMATSNTTRMLKIRLSDDGVVKIGSTIEARVTLELVGLSAPLGGPAYPPRPPPLEATWVSNNQNIALTSWKSIPCPPSPQCSSSVVPPCPPPNPTAGCFDFTVGQILGVATGTAEIVATHTLSSREQLTATAKVTVVPASIAAVTVLSPNGSERPRRGDSFYITWKITNGAPGIWVGRVTLFKGGSFITDIFPFPSGFQSNTVSSRWDISQSLAPGDDYSVDVHLFQGSTSSAQLINSDSSDLPFSIMP